MSGDLTLDLTPNDSKLRADPVARLAITLAKELWMMKDRQIVLEHALARHGVDVRDLIEREAPDEPCNQQLAGERKRFVAEVIAALKGPGDRA